MNDSKYTSCEDETQVKDMGQRSAGCSQAEELKSTTPMADFTKLKSCIRLVGDYTPMITRADEKKFEAWD